MPDISSATLCRRKDFLRITTALRTHGIRYRWGFPTKLIITENGKTTLIPTSEDGLKLLD
ncbi:Hypothetical predicted protein, partial [Pelobates cultripes]